MTSGSEPDAPIGVFDSGVGGLTVLRALEQALPNERFLYVGDTARVPWGTKGPLTVERYSARIARYLQGKGCKAIVIACNTASAYALDAVREAVRLPVVDVISPVASLVATQPAPTGNRCIAVLGTRGTVRSEAYVHAIHAVAANLRVVQQACPLFVPLAEEGWTEGAVPLAVACTYLDDLVSRHAPSDIILGCTHYPLLRDVIAQALRSLTQTPPAIIESGAATAQALADLMGLQTHSPRQGTPHHARSVLQVTDDSDSFPSLASRFLGRPVQHAEHIDLPG